MLGNLESKRDWGFAGDYVQGMWHILRQPKPDNYVLATDKSHTVREFIELATQIVEFNIEWQGTAKNELAIDKKTGQTIISIDHPFFRPTEINVLLSDASKAQKVFGWQPKTSFVELVEMMAEFGLQHVSDQK